MICGKINKGRKTIFSLKLYHSLRDLTRYAILFFNRFVSETSVTTKLVRFRQFQTRKTVVSILKFLYSFFLFIRSFIFFILSVTTIIFGSAQFSSNLIERVKKSGIINAGLKNFALQEIRKII